MILHFDPIVHAGRHSDAFSARAARSAIARETLRSDFLAAFADPSSLIETPASSQRFSSLLEVVSDSLAGTRGDQYLHELLRIVAGAAAGDDMQMRADAWMAAQASDFAGWHADDLAADLDDDEDAGPSAFDEFEREACMGADDE